MQQVKNSGVRYVVWLDGSTDRVASGGGITCAAGIGGGCMGLAWWEDDSRYDATVWDIKQAESAGTIHADVKGRSVMPAIIIPIPFIARPQAAASRSHPAAEAFLTSLHGYGAGPEPGIG
jgi:hypothetical protein